MVSKEPKITKGKEYIPSGLLYVPYKSITLYAEMTDENGVTTRTRQVSRWTIFKYWVRGLFYKTHKL